MAEGFDVGDNRHEQGPNEVGRASKRERREPLPKIVWFLMFHCGIGLALGVIFTSIIIQLNTAGLKDMLVASSEPFIPLFVLYAMTALTFGSLNMGIAIMSLPRDEKDGDGGL